MGSGIWATLNESNAISQLSPCHTVESMVRALRTAITVW